MWFFLIQRIFRAFKSDFISLFCRQKYDSIDGQLGNAVLEEQGGTIITMCQFIMKFPQPRRVFTLQSTTCRTTHLLTILQ